MGQRTDFLGTVASTTRWGPSLVFHTAKREAKNKVDFHLNMSVAGVGLLRLLVKNQKCPLYIDHRVYLPPGGYGPNARRSTAFQTRPQRRAREVGPAHPGSRPHRSYGRLRGIGPLLNLHRFLTCTDHCSIAGRQIYPPEKKTPASPKRRRCIWLKIRVARFLFCKTGASCTRIFSPAFMLGLSSVVSILTLVPIFLYAAVCLASALHGNPQDVSNASRLRKRL